MVDGKIENPLTGAIQPRGRFCKAGTPSIDVVWSNKTPTRKFQGFRGPSYLDVDKLLANVATLCQVSDMRLVTVTASHYHVFVLCETSEVDVHGAVSVSSGWPEGAEKW